MKEVSMMKNHLLNCPYYTYSIFAFLLVACGQKKKLLITKELINQINLICV